MAAPVPEIMDTPSYLKWFAWLLVDYVFIPYTVYLLSSKESYVAV
jgi:hypothetical protein